VQSLSASGVPVGGIVAGAPPGFGSPDANLTALGLALDALAALPLARGIRGSGINWTDARALAAAAVHARMLAARGLSLDIIGSAAAHGRAMAALAAAAPDLTVVLDHVGSPAARNASAFADWAAGLAAVAAAPNVAVKLGGVLQYFKDASRVLPAPAATAPFVRAALAAFGWQRVLFEGNWFFNDWPGRLDVYAAWLPMLNAALAPSVPTLAQRDALFYQNAQRVYRVALQ
jgi:predicted TIM-barrel fold metal-dependent hydrolase